MTEAMFDERGALARDVTISGVALSKGMTPAQRMEALAKADAGGTYSPTSTTGSPPVGWQTESTQTRLAQGDAEGKAPDHAALDQTFAKLVTELRGKGLPETQYKAKYLDLKRAYEQKLSGIYAAQLKRSKAPPA